MRDLVRAVLVALLLVAKDLLGDNILKEPLRNIGAPESLAPLALVGLLVLVFLILDQVVLNLAHLPLLRGWCFPRANLEGYWYQKVDVADRPHSISCLRHSLLRKTWEYEGSGYAQDFERKARWTSKPIEYYPAKEFWMFRGVSVRIENGNEQGEGNVVSVLYLSTCEPNVGTARSLSGRVLDLDFEDLPAGFNIKLHRITSEDWKKAGLKKGHKLDRQSAEKLISDLSKRT